MNAGGIKCLVGVDIANACHNFAVHEKGLDRLFSRPSQGHEMGRGAGLAERFRPGGPEKIRLYVLCLFGGQQPHCAKTSGVVEAHLKTIVQLPADMVMDLERGGVGEDAKVAGHAQMDDEKRLVFGLNEQILGSSRDSTDRLAAESLVHKAMGNRVTQIFAAALDGSDDPPGEVRAQAQADDLNLRELRHCFLQVERG